jgi:hypothetical protein
VTVAAPRSLGGKHVLRRHWPAHTAEDGWAIPACRAGNPDADYQPAAETVHEVTCARCVRVLASRDRQAAAVRPGR